MTARIDFPKYGTTHTSTDATGQVTSWTKINNSWVKQFDYSLESPYMDGKLYGKRNQIWSEVVFPLNEAPIDATYYARKDGVWEAMAIAAAGPAFSEVTPGLYGLDQATNAWALLPNSDLTANYYDKTTSDARFAGAVHQHVLADITDSGALAAEEDAGTPTDDIQYVRTNQVWAPLVLPTISKGSKAITIIDPQSTDDALIFRTPSGVEIDSVHVVVIGGGSAVINIAHASTADGSGGSIVNLFNSDQTVNNAQGEALTVNNVVVPAGNYMWLIIQGDPVNVTMLHITVAYK